jgi:NAD(P)-dependent dehydrogenase (short-subunit alcohol dehydrogenase family)
MELNGKVAIVTGGAVRLGRALALALAEQGVRLIIHYGSSAGPAQETVTEIKAMGSDALAVQAVQDILRAIGEDVNQEGLFALVNRLGRWVGRGTGRLLEMK